MTPRITKVAGQEPVNPVRLDELKLHLGITHDEQDVMLRSQLAAALENAENYTRRAIASCQYTIKYDRFPVWQYLELPLGYITAVDSIKYLDANGAEQTWSSANYQTDLATNYRPRIYSTNGWPSIGDYIAAAIFTVTAGWSNAAVPYTVREAIKLLAAASYYARVPGDEDPAAIRQAAHLLLDQWSLPIW